MAFQKRHRRTFSEDERIQAQENVKKVEDDDNGEISEPEDPMMLQRDAKDWKVCTLIVQSNKRMSLFLQACNRDKTTTLYSVSPNTATEQQKIRSNGPTARRFSVTILTKKR